MSQPTKPRRDPAATEPVVSATQTFTLKVVPEGAPDVWRTVELPATATMATLHEVIQRSFDHDGEHRYAFFVAGPAEDSLAAYGFGDEPAMQPPDRGVLGALGLAPGQELGYRFECGEEIYHAVTVIAVGEAVVGESYPRVVDAHGDPPPQYGSDDDLPPLAAELVPLAEAALDAVRAFEIRERSADTGPLPLDVVRADAALGERLAVALAGRRAQLDAMDETLDADFGGWLAVIPFDLLDHGLADQAVALSGLVTQIDPDHAGFQGDRGIILANAGRHDEARAVAEELLRRHADDPEAVDRAASVFVASGDDARGEALSRQVLALYEADADADGFADADVDARIVQAGALERLADILDRRGETDAAADLQAKADALLDVVDADEEGQLDGYPFLPPPPPAAPVVRATPKVGRNEPCPCGSGKKFKKCHGA